MSNQYTLNSIAHYEAVFGQDFVSPGGKEMATELIRSMDLNPGARVLDVGCGLGGCAFVMARDFGLFVEGIDLSSDMIDQACSRCHEYGLEKQVSLHVANCLDYRPEQLFDAVFSRDVFLHIADKTRLFDSLFSFLKPGGKLLFTDYCCGPRPWSDEFSDYVNERGYTLHTTDEYVTHIAEAGFDNTQGKDASSRFLEILESELSRMETLDLDRDTVDSLRSAWKSKISRVTSGDHRWGLFQAKRPPKSGV